MSYLSFEPSPSLSSLRPDQNWFKQFCKDVQEGQHGFYVLPDQLNAMAKDVLALTEQFSHKKTFVHVGIGGSSLGPEALIEALASPDKKKCFYFLNNIDPDLNHEILYSLNLKETVFYIVSKSGSTPETLAQFSLIINLLSEKNISQDEWKNYLVICTDPHQGCLREIVSQYQLPSLSIPPELGGRYSVLSTVGLFPAAFAQLDLNGLILGAQVAKKEIFNDHHFLREMAGNLFCLYRDHGINQTVFMPYSSKLATLGKWFVQLWAESLGKKLNLQQKEVFEGLTPIAALGATDQHSQMQLFMEGPKDKFIFFLKINKTQHQLDLTSVLEHPKFDFLKNRTLNQLIHAELKGTKQALNEVQRPWAEIKLENLNEESWSYLVFWWQALTVAVGHLMQVNPFDQPGVEAGKRYSFKYLAEISHD